MKALRILVLCLGLILASKVTAQGQKDLVRCLVGNGAASLIISRKGPQVDVRVVNLRQGELQRVSLRHPVIVEFGGVFIVLEDRGRSGYFYLRTERDLEDEDDGRVDVRIESNLVGLEDPYLQTNGELRSISSCHGAGY